MRYRIRSVDAFGTDLGPASGQIVASVRGGSATAISSAGLSASGHELGRYSVVARAGHLIGRASLHVQKGTRR